MSLKFRRQKDRHFLLSLLYKLDKYVPLSGRRKLKLYLDLEWIFERLAHERSFSVFPEHPVRQKTFSFLQKHLSSAHRVLDLGCSTGTLSRQIADRVKFVAAIDHNPELIVVAQKEHPPANLVFETADAAEFLSRSPELFDVLILSHVLEHLDNPKEFLQTHMARFGNLYIEVPDLERTPLNEYRMQLKSQLQYSDSDHIWEFTREDIHALLDSCGLQIVDSEFRYGVQKYWCKNPSAK
jgi:SAM-dependent methyltransferase